MLENNRYGIQGTAALAYRDEHETRGAIIDYDVARRSYEARCRLAARQANLARKDQHISRGRPNRNTEKAEFQRIVEDAYTPGRTASQALGDFAREAQRAIASHPFIDQLKYGSLKGAPIGNATYRQVFGTTAVCTVLSAITIFVGA